MLFESLSKLKRDSILTAILCMALGSIMLICPARHIISLTVIFGYSILILAMVMMMEFMSGKKSIMDYLKFTAALVFAIIGFSVLSYKNDIMKVLAWLFGFLLVCDGIHSMYHSFTYVRRAKRPGWWVLTIFSGLLIVTGIIIFANPWWNTPALLMKVIGGAILFAALVSVLRLIWTWPLRD